MMIDRSLVPVGEGVVTVDPHSLLLMRNGKREDLSISSCYQDTLQYKLATCLTATLELYAFCRSAILSPSSPHFASIVRYEKYI
jgi:hypothetical protein